MTNNKNVLRVLNGFLELSTEEKLILKKELDQTIIDGVLTNSAVNTLKKSTVQIMMKSHLGPTFDNNCKCCGK